jgi:hypothetical protein
MCTRLAVAACIAACGVASSAHGSIVWATHVEHFDQGFKKNGGSIDANRSDPTKALFAPQGTDTLNFVSLGFGGEIVLSFGTPFAHQAIVVETTYGNPAGHPEAAELFVGIGATWDVAAWYAVGIIQNTADNQPISLAGVMAESGQSAFNFVRIVDRTNPALHGAEGDGFDVDGVGVMAVPAPGTFALAMGAMVVGARRRRA